MFTSSAGVDIWHRLVCRPGGIALEEANGRLYARRCGNTGSATTSSSFSLLQDVTGD
jgi:hypothetical protein